MQPTEETGKDWSIWGNSREAIDTNLTREEAKEVVDNDLSGTLYAMHDVTGEEYEGA